MSSAVSSPFKPMHGPSTSCHKCAGRGRRAHEHLMEQWQANQAGRGRHLHNEASVAPAVEVALVSFQQSPHLDNTEWQASTSARECLQAGRRRWAPVSYPTLCLPCPGHKPPPAPATIPPPHQPNTTNIPEHTGTHTHQLQLALQGAEALGHNPPPVVPGGVGLGVLLQRPLDQRQLAGHDCHRGLAAGVQHLAHRGCSGGPMR